MKKIFSSLLLFSLIFSVKAPKISNVALNARPLAATNIDYTSRLNQAGIELNKSKADLLNEINASEQELNNFIKKNRNFYKNLFAQQIEKYKKENKCRKFATGSKLINEVIQKNPDIEILVVENFFAKCGSPAITVGQTIFVDNKFADKPGLILHEICHALNDDQIYICALDSFVEHYNKTNKHKKNNHNLISNLKCKFCQKIEKRADLWSASHGKDYAMQLANFFKSLSCASTEAHPSLDERIAYLI